ncbi:MAG: diphosphate--fructose-6-phosphate 1-phosphotransferase [Faecalibacterium sp.]
MANLLIAHGGAPTTVINASLYGAVMAAKQSGKVEHIYGAIHGSAGILNEEFIDLAAQPQAELDKLLHTPASAIGTSRTPLYEKEYARMAEVLQKHDIGYVLFTGGNGSMDTCGRLYKACEGKVLVAGIPKTIDNDIAVIDHAPGFGSAARFIAMSVAEIAQDVQAMPIHVCIIETMGRNAGWLTAAAALARTEEGGAPDLIYLPEVAFDEEAFLRDVTALYQKKGGVVVVVSEGLKNADGSSIAPPLFKTERATYAGPVASYLAKLVIEKTGIKARSETPGIWGRSSAQNQSPVDCEEAVRMGAMAANAVLSGTSGVMAGMMRKEGAAYAVEDVLVPIEKVMMDERLLPAEYIAPSGNDVTQAFIEWCRPLVGELPIDFANFRTPDEATKGTGEYKTI